jgi:hypothetical protein
MDLVSWLPTAAITALGIVLWRKLDKQDKRLDELREMMRVELRTMDVRISLIEAHIWPTRDRVR